MPVRESATPDHRHIHIVLALLALILVGLALLARSVAAKPDVDRHESLRKQPPGMPLLTPTPGCGLAWREVSSPPAVGSSNNSFTGIAVVSANDIWAVGSYYDGSTNQTLIGHWDGSSWSIVPSPNVGSSDNVLRSVAAVSANDVWAVGYYHDGGDANRTLVQRWNGSTWNVVPSPNVSPFNNVLRSVAVVSANDIWAVGSYVSRSYANQTLAAHWNGSTWSIVPTPNVGSSENILRSVAVVSTDDVWAVGGYHDGNAEQTLIEHWNGSSWSIVPSPNATSSYNFLISLAVVSANDVWAVGYYYGGGNDNGSINQTLVEHWDGSSWSIVPSPNVGSSHTVFRNIAVVSANDVWAVGNYVDGGIDQTLVVHWDGSTWSIVPSPNVGSLDNFLRSIAVVSANDVWAVGYYYDGSIYHTLVERYSASCGTPSPTPRPPTTTPIAATATPTNVTCVLKFADVPPNNTFYPFVTCLACRGIDSGVPCGGPNEPCDPNHSNYFRVNTLIKRDDLAHMVAASAGFNEDPGPRRFQDVPPNNPYYNWVQRMANRSLIGGYPCGTIPTEPCVGPNNLAYYRPTANATRGQIAKIVSNGAGYNNPPVGQTFEDVPPSHPFYIWVQRLTSQPVPAMGGYPCGGAGEPCGPGNKPYFRWGNNATRGQSAKITANTFYPNCRVTVITPTPAPTFTPAPPTATPIP